MNRETVGEALAARLCAAETAIDAALHETAMLAAMLPRARAEAFLSAVTGQKVFEGVAAGLSALTEARGHLVDSHHALAGLARRLGLENLAMGPVDKPEDRPRARRGMEQAAKLNKSLPNSPTAC